MFQTVHRSFTQDTNWIYWGKKSFLSFLSDSKETHFESGLIEARNWDFFNTLTPLSNPHCSPQHWSTMPLLWRHCGDSTARHKVKNLQQSAAHLLRTFFFLSFVWINHSLVTASTLPFPSHTQEKHKKATAECAKKKQKKHQWTCFGENRQKCFGVGGDLESHGRGRRRAAAAAAVVVVDVLRWLNFMNQGVVADSWGAGLTMTLLHSSRIARTQIHLHTHATNRLLMLQHHSSLFDS